MIKRILSFATMIFLSGCASLASAPLATSSNSESDPVVQADTQLQDLGQAPELVNSTWLNTERHLTSADFAGKVLLIEFWTFG